MPNTAFRRTGERVGDANGRPKEMIGPEMADLPQDTPMPPQVSELSNWQIAAIVAPLLAAGVALLLLVINLMHRRGDNKRRTHEKEQQALAQARLVITGDQPPDLEGVMFDRIGKPRYRIESPLANAGDRPILDVRLEVWLNDPTIDQPRVVAPTSVVRPGGKHDFRTYVVSDRADLAVTAWRIRWSDADGRKWFREHSPQDQPARYTGQPPCPMQTDSSRTG